MSKDGASTSLEAAVLFIVAAAKPWRSAFIRERSLPCCVCGPRLLAALRLFARICRCDAMTLTFSVLRPIGSLSGGFGCRQAQGLSSSPRGLL